MRAWHFSENAYPFLPPAEEYDSIRVTLPNRLYDPKKGAELYDRFISEWQIAEEEGLNIMLNEHHQTATCVDPAAPLVLAALARLTTKARLLILGNPIANRRQPVRVAEEMALIDVLSKGRLEAGFVRGVPNEILPANSNPVRMNERHWEALDLIIQAWTSHDGPTSFEGRFFHHRNINIWPRPYQTAASAGVGQHDEPRWCHPRRRARLRAGDLSHRLQRNAAVYDAYRKGWREAGRGEDVPIDRLAYAAMVYVADSEAKARAGAEKILWYITANKVSPYFAIRRAKPGRRQCADAAGRWRRRIGNFGANATVDAAVNAARCSPARRTRSLRRSENVLSPVGGFGHLLIMGQAGFLEHDETVRSIRNFARHVFPRLKAEMPDDTISGFSIAPEKAAV